MLIFKKYLLLSNFSKISETKNVEKEHNSIKEATKIEEKKDVKLESVKDIKQDSKIEEKTGDAKHPHYNTKEIPEDELKKILGIN